MCHSAVPLRAKICPWCGHRFGVAGKAGRAVRVAAYVLVTLLVLFIVYGCYFSGGTF